jgi:hypothetical protein
MATYLDNAGVTQILTKIKSLLAKKAEITAIPTKTSQLTNDSYYQTEYDVNTKITNKLNTLDLADKDIPSTIDEGQYFVSELSQENGLVKAKKTQFATMFTINLEAAQSQGDVVTSEQLSQSIVGAVGKITSFEYKIVDSLPAVSDGKKGVIYLIAHSGSTNQNSYDEYIFLPADGSTAARYEKIGTTDIDLTPYAKKTEIPTKVSQLTNDSTYASVDGVQAMVSTAIGRLGVGDVAEEGKYVSSVSQTNGVIKVTRASLPAVGTADSPISNTTIESIFTQVFG